MEKNHASRNASLSAPLNALDWTDILTRLQSLATSELARSRLRDLKPLASAEEARRSFRSIEEAQAILAYGERPFMESLDLFSTWFQRLKREAVLTTLELRDASVSKWWRFLKWCGRFSRPGFRHSSSA